MKILRYYLNGTLLEHSPEGFDDNVINKLRNTTYHGISGKFTSEFTFVLDGATILREAFYNGGYEAECVFTIEQLDGITLLYSQIFIGLIDFSTFKDDKNSVSVSISESSQMEILKANESTDFEIDIDHQPYLEVQATFPYLKQQLVMRTDESVESLVGDASIGLYVVSSEQKVDTVSPQESFPKDGVDVPGELDSFVVVNSANKEFTMHITGNLRTRVNSANCTIRVDLYKYDHDTGWSSSWNLAIIEDLAPSSTTSDLPIDFTVNETVFAQPGDGYGIGLLVTSSGGGEALTWIDYVNVELNYLAKVPDKTIRALRPNVVVAQLFLAMGLSPAFYLDFFIRNNDFLITCGDAIRGLTGSKIKISFKTLFESFNAMFNIGMGLGEGTYYDRILIEDKGFFYQMIEIANIGEVSDLETSCAREFIYSALKIGYEDRTFDDVSGRFEVNSTQEYSLPVKKVANTLELISKIRADFIGITLTSLNLEGKTTTDSESDDDVFILHTKTDGVDTLLNRDFDSGSVTGFPDPEGLFNLSLTPKRCLLRHMDFLTSSLTKLSDKSVKFRSATKNASFESKLTGEEGAIFENGDLAIVNFIGTEMFLPYLFTFRKNIPRDFNSLMNNKNNGYITFTWMGNTYKGFILDVGVNPQQNSEYTFKLLATPDTDISKLIR